MSSDEIIVKWEADDGGWRQGVLCAIAARNGTCLHVPYMKQRMRGETSGDKDYDKAIIYDRIRNERAIVPLSAVSLVEPRCPKCGGDGVVDAVATTGSAGTAYRCKTSCECQPKAKP